jgi:hypothetical protein
MANFVAEELQIISGVRGKIDSVEAKQRIGSSFSALLPPITNN